MKDDRRLIEDFLPIQAIGKEASRFCEIPAEAIGLAGERN
jgi:hypothetical protein